MRKRRGKGFLCLKTNKLCPYKGYQPGTVCPNYEYGKTGGAENRIKGHSAERRLVRVCKELGIDAKRNLGETRKELQGVDVIIDDKIFVQVKCGKSVPFKRAMRQIKEFENSFIYFEDTDLHVKGIVVLCDNNLLRRFIKWILQKS